MSNKYLEKIAKILPNLKQFGGLKNAVKGALKSDKAIAKEVDEPLKAFRDNHEKIHKTGKIPFETLREEKVKSLKDTRGSTRKELAKGLGIGAAGTAAVGTGAAVANKKNKK